MKNNMLMRQEKSRYLYGPCFLRTIYEAIFDVWSERRQEIMDRHNPILGQSEGQIFCVLLAMITCIIG